MRSRGESEEWRGRVKKVSVGCLRTNWLYKRVGLGMCEDGGRREGIRGEQRRSVGGI